MNSRDMCEYHVNVDYMINNPTAPMIILATFQYIFEQTFYGKHFQNIKEYVIIIDEVHNLAKFCNDQLAKNPFTIEVQNVYPE